MRTGAAKNKSGIIDIGIDGDFYGMTRDEAYIFCQQITAAVLDVTLDEMADTICHRIQEMK